MNQFIQRVANYVANEILIKGLANSKTFQKFAVRTDARLRSMKDASNDSINSKLDEIHKAASEQAYSSSSSSGAAGRKGGGSGSGGGASKMEMPRAPEGGLAGFLSALGKEIGGDLGLRSAASKVK